MNQLIPTLSYQSLKPWFDKPALIDECVAQVQKDLGSYGISLIYSGNANNAYEVAKVITCKYHSYGNSL